MISISLRPGIEQQLTELAGQRGVSSAELAGALIEEALDDLSDTRLAEHRLGNRRPALNADQARRALGLDD